MKKMTILLSLSLFLVTPTYSIFDEVPQNALEKISGVIAAKLIFPAMAGFCANVTGNKTSHRIINNVWGSTFSLTCVEALNTITKTMIEKDCFPILVSNQKQIAQDLLKGSNALAACAYILGAFAGRITHHSLPKIRNSAIKTGNMAAKPFTALYSKTTNKA
jgi:hypothetical protein